MRHLVALLLLSRMVFNLEALKVVENDFNCETLNTYSFVYFNVTIQENEKNCLVHENTVINIDDVSFLLTSDYTIDGINFNANKKIQFLPVKIFQSFPNLRGYFAGNLNVSKVSHKNLQRLAKLEVLYLNGNQIEKMKSDTFEGLLKLRIVNLEYNKIHKMNGMLYDGLPALFQVFLWQNPCTNDTFYDYDIPKLPRIITERCGFNETRRLFKLNCGAGSISTSRILGGTETIKGQFPFMVALLKGPGRKFFCGGNLITSKHVLTAAHCIQDKRGRKKLEPNDLTVYVGRHDISPSANEPNSEVHSVDDIHVHPDWKTYDLKYNADLAVVVLEKNVQFSEFIQPICLTSDSEIEKYDVGVVVGWGKSESPRDHEDIPRQVSIRAVSAETCFAKDFLLGTIFSPRMFCAGGEEAGPCKGDSGGGFYVKIRGFWTLLGVVCSAPVKSNRECDVSRFTLYTSVTQYADWITTTVDGTNSRFSFQ